MAARRLMLRAFCAGFLVTAVLLALDSTSDYAPPAPDRRVSVAAPPTRLEPPVTEETEATPAPTGLATCERALERKLVEFPLEFRPGDDNLKASVRQVLYAAAEISMSCPNAELVVQYRTEPASNLRRARALSLVKTLRMLGVPSRAAGNGNMPKATPGIQLVFLSRG